MAYTEADRSHDEALISKLTEAKFVEEKHDGAILIRLAHLTGCISFCDGLMSWTILGQSVGSSKAVNQADIDGSAAYLTNYARKALHSEMDNLARTVIASAQARLAA